MTHPPIQRLSQGQQEHGPKPSSPGKPRLWACVALSALGLLGPVSAQAGFTGYYDVANWTKSTPAPTVTYLPTGQPSPFIPPDAIKMTGATAGNTTYTFQILAQTAGDIAFDWTYTTTTLGVSNNIGGFLLNGGKTSLAFGTLSATGHFSLNNLLATDTFGFYIQHTTAGGAAANLYIYNLAAPVVLTNPTPEPSSLALLAMGAIGLRMARRNAGRLEKSVA